MIICKLENGHEAKLRHATITSIVKNNKREILLVRRARGQINEGKLTLPGGFMDRDEDSQEASIREVKEETGLIVKILFLFHIIDTPDRVKEDRQNVEFRYVTEVVGGKEATSNETSELIWITEKTLPSEDDFAFDHRRTLLKYFEYLKNPFPLPIFNY